ncbi:MAG: alkaline phosphatase [Saprospiraceae bacterium]
MKFRFFSLIAICSILLFSCETPAPKVEEAPKPKNIILMVGDGMGVTQVTAGIYTSKDSLNLEQFPVIGLHKSYASNDLITDSAAGATAFSCGVKTYNGAIGVNPDTIAVKTILEIAEEHDLATGLVSTSTITHATPGSFIAHQKNRKMHEEIAKDFLNVDFDLFAGGGKTYFESRKDSLNLSEELKKKGYNVSDFFQVKPSELVMDASKPLVYYTANTNPVAVSEGRDYLPSISGKSARFLDERAKENGFFLMIEGSQIDWGGHANESDYIITEMHDFDKAIGEVLEFAKQDGETLIIVTADHETGGYAINKGSKRDSLVTAFTTDYHTADLIPVFAYGPGSEEFAGIYENTAIFDKMKELFGFE